MKKMLKGAQVLMNEVSKPSLWLTSKELPEINKWKNGKYYDIIIKVKQVSSSLLPSGKGSEARFEIESAKPYEGSEDDN